jgi:hypothetical protein
MNIKKDNGENRLGIDRRRFSYSDYYPERRSGIDRRQSVLCSESFLRNIHILKQPKTYTN